jgi:hypothetical protein
MRNLALVLLAASLLLAACRAGDPDATPTLPAVDATATLPAAPAAASPTVAPLDPAATQAQATADAAVASPPPATAAILTAEAAATAVGAAPPGATPADPATSAGLAGAEDSLRAYRVMITMQVNAALAHETAHQAAIGRLAPDERPVAALALAGLMQTVDEAAPNVSPPAALAGPWQQASDAHEQVRAIAGRWLLGVATAAQAEAELAAVLEQLEQALLAADQAMADEYGLQAGMLSEYRQRIVAATARVYD